MSGWRRVKFLPTILNSSCDSGRSISWTGPASTWRRGRGGWRGAGARVRQGRPRPHTSGARGRLVRRHPRRQRSSATKTAPNWGTGPSSAPNRKTVNRPIPPRMPNSGGGAHCSLSRTVSAPCRPACTAKSACVPVHDYGSAELCGPPVLEHLADSGLKSAAKSDRAAVRHRPPRRARVDSPSLVMKRRIAELELV